MSRRATIEDRDADSTTTVGRLRRLAWSVQGNTAGVTGADAAELLSAADDLSTGQRAVALVRRLLGGKTWVLVHDPATYRATFVTVGTDNEDKTLGDDILAMAKELGLADVSLLDGLVPTPKEQL